ncbi:hypothetical protein [Xenorhabdus siamensis]
MLVPGAKPLIRFRTGDLACLQSPEVCGCGDHSRCLRVFGRINDVMTLGGRLILPSSIESAVLRTSERVWGYQVTVLETNSGADEIEISMIAQIEGRSVTQTQKQMEEFFNVPVRLHLVEQLDPRTETGAYISWKYARIQDKRNPTL